jgi:hypothetical protein
MEISSSSRFHLSVFSFNASVRKRHSDRAKDFYSSREENNFGWHPNTRLRNEPQQFHTTRFGKGTIMSLKNLGKLVLGLAVMAAFTSIAGQTAHAQVRINDKVARNNGAPFFANSRTSRNIQHARDYSRSIQQYTTRIPTIDPVVTQAESQTLGDQIQCIQRDMGIIREANASNPQVLEQVKGIDTKLAQVSNTQKMLHEECCKDAPDGKACGDMAGKLTHTLDQVSKDHAKLLKTMGHEDAAHDQSAMTHEHAATEGKTPAKSGK